MNFLKNFAEVFESKEIVLKLKNFREHTLSERELAKSVANLINHPDNLRLLIKVILTLTKEPGSIKNELEFCDNVIKIIDLRNDKSINRSKFKEFLSNSLISIEDLIKLKINSKLELDIKFIIGYATLIAHLYLSDLTTLKVVFKWCQSVLISQQNCFIRRNLLEIIKDKVKGLIRNEKSSSIVAKLYDAIQQERLYDELGEMPMALNSDRR